MSEIVSEKDVRHIALLARLELSDEEIRRYARELNSILGYVEKLNDLDTQSVEPTSHALRLRNVFREDVPRPSLDPKQSLLNAPETQAGHFKVPPIIQES
ncbi:MAG TPA: Asp-tRNA(Asn)/Glu-tRNA(Gln) amidotransferase subunit GatC [Sumerlaeia bacterium]|nr:Asp-tRNA(Asn)/Glu-tRNA(Gln) amidotransferase subunit GatC [Sumerlaeia bacterium]